MQSHARHCASTHQCCNLHPQNTPSTNNPRVRALDFLELASRLARPQWTQFGTTSMVLGLVAVALALAAQALGAYVALAPRGIEKKPKAPVSTLTSVPRLLSLGTAICAAVPVLGIFSFFYLLNEGGWLGRAAKTRAVCGGVSPDSSWEHE